MLFIARASGFKGWMTSWHFSRDLALIQLSSNELGSFATESARLWTLAPELMGIRGVPAFVVDGRHDGNSASGRREPTI